MECIFAHRSLSIFEWCVTTGRTYRNRINNGTYYVQKWLCYGLAGSWLQQANSSIQSSNIEEFSLLTEKSIKIVLVKK